MLYIGCHLSCVKGYLAMGEQALALGADTFQFFYAQSARRQRQAV